MPRAHLCKAHSPSLIASPNRVSWFGGCNKHQVLGLEICPGILQLYKKKGDKRPGESYHTVSYGIWDTESAERASSGLYVSCKADPGHYRKWNAGNYLRV